MNKLAVTLALSAISLFGRSAETVYFRAILSSANEVPPVPLSASGTATVIAHIVRDDAGEVSEGSVDFLVNYSFPGAVTLTGMHIHPAPAGVNGGVVIDSGLSPANSVAVDASGQGSIERQAQVRATNAAGVAALRGMLTDPSQYYTNLHTTDNPAGVIRGQLQRAEVTVLMGLMSPLNEVPAITGLAASGVAAVTVIRAANSTQMIFDTSYRFPSQVTFTGYHIHNGPAGVNAGVVFNSGIGSGAASVTADPTGAGSLRRPVEVGAAQADLVNAMLADPSGFYINLHTTEFPGGVIRAPLRRTDTMRFPVTMLPSNEAPPITGIDASAPAVVRAHTIRYEDGSVRAGYVNFDVNFRFPDAAQFTGLHIHDAPVGVSGPVTINSGLSAANPVNTDTGFGNISRSTVVSEGPALATLNSLVRNPENHYVNLHTAVNPGGVIRAQLTAPNTAAAAISSVVAANLDPNATTLAQGGLISIFGTNLAKVTTDLSGWEGKALPDFLNGVAVAVGTERARLLYVSPTQVNALLPFETGAGRQLASVNNGNAPSPAVAVNVAAAAPAIFFNSQGGIIVKSSDSSLVGRANPARAGDLVLIYATGLGQTTPALESGTLAPSSPIAGTAPVTVTIGGKDAEVVSSAASPGFAGLYQVAVRVPAGLTAGDVPVVLRAGEAATGGAASTPVTMAVQ